MLCLSTSLAGNNNLLPKQKSHRNAVNNTGCERLLWYNAGHVIRRMQQCRKRTEVKISKEPLRSEDESRHYRFFSGAGVKQKRPAEWACPGSKLSTHSWISSQDDTFGDGKRIFISTKIALELKSEREIPKVPIIGFYISFQQRYFFHISKNKIITCKQECTFVPSLRNQEQSNYIFFSTTWCLKKSK